MCSCLPFSLGDSEFLNCKHFGVTWPQWMDVQIYRQCIDDKAVAAGPDLLREAEARDKGVYVWSHAVQSVLVLAFEHPSDVE